MRRFLQARWKTVLAGVVKYRALRSCQAGIDIRRSDWTRSLSDPTDFYVECFCYFHRQIPAELKAHRRYFQQQRRGFGEDAFHTMWFLLFQEFRPANFLEIGVYRGQVISLIALLAQRNGSTCDVHGISPFSSSGDSVSRYLSTIDYYADTLGNFEAFRLPAPRLLRAYSTDDKARELIRSRLWDIAYIDGNHDYEIARADWGLCSTQVKPGGLIVLDDAGLSSPYQPPVFATRGHPGPSKVASEIVRDEFREILQVGHNRVFQKVQ